MSNSPTERDKPANFPTGAEWLRADFHLHTAADAEFKYAGTPELYNSDYTDALKSAGIRLGVITNHNKFDVAEFNGLRSAATKKEVALLPGVELSVDDGGNGVHTLIVFSEGWLTEGQDRINSFLSVAFEGKTPNEYQRENGRCSHSIKEIIKKLEAYGQDFFLIFAHVEQRSGLWLEIDGGRLEEFGRHEPFRRRTLAFRKVRTHDGAGKDRPCRTKVQAWLKPWYPAEVEGSDPKSISEVGKGTPCYLKLGEMSFDAVKFALFDHQHRVRSRKEVQAKATAIRNIRFEGAGLGGSTVRLSGSLNCLIGPRGNGKSAIIECLRHALGMSPGASDDRYKSGLVERMLTPGGKVILEAVNEFGQEVRIERERTGAPSVFLEETYREIAPTALLKDILYFGQKDLSTRSESFDQTFLEKLLADRLDPQAEEETKLAAAVTTAAQQFKEAQDARGKLEVLRKEQKELEVQLQVYSDKGVDKKLEEITLFDSDRQAVVAWQTAIKNLGKSLKESATAWSDVDELLPALRSKLISEISADIQTCSRRVSEAKASVETGLESLRSALALIGESLKKLEPVQAQLKTDLAALQQELDEPNLDLEVFRKKKARLDQLTKLLAAGSKHATTEQAAREQVGAAVTQLHDFWRERFQEREAKVRELEAELPPGIRIRTAFKGKRAAFEEFLKTIFRGSGLQGGSCESLRDAFVDGRELYQGRVDLEKHVSETAATKVRTLLLYHLAEFLRFRTPDEIEIFYEGKPLGDYSLGQRATVILHIIMNLSRHPVILIDQPEDDLDNETLYSHFIRQLLERKEATQFIFATHNPNIPVLGDADQVIVCRKDGEAFTFEHGSIDARNIQQRIVTVMEGGEDAFRRRKDIYQLWRSSN